MIKITLKGGSTKEYNEVTTVMQVAESISAGLITVQKYDLDYNKLTGELYKKHDALASCFLYKII